MLSSSHRLLASKSASAGSAHLFGSTAQVSGSSSLAVVKSFDRGNFCNLCKEPFGQWNEHRGKRDHISLELFFNVIAEHARSWKAEQVLWDYQDRFDPSLRNQKILDDDLLRMHRKAGNIQQEGEREYLTNQRLLQRAKMDRKRRKLIVHRTNRLKMMKKFEIDSSTMTPVPNKNDGEDQKQHQQSQEPIIDEGDISQQKAEIAALLRSERKLSRDLTRYDSNRFILDAANLKKQQQKNGSAAAGPLIVENIIDNNTYTSGGSKTSPIDLPSDRVVLRSLFNHSDAEQRERRTRSFAIMKHLQELGVIYLGPHQWKDPKLNKINMGHNGALVLFWMQHPQIIHLFPRADAAQIASFSQVCYSMYSLETVFDFFGMGDLIDIREVASPQSISASGSASASSVNQQQQKNESNSSMNRTLINASVDEALEAKSVLKQGIKQNTDLLNPMKGDEFTYDLTWFDKSIIIRNVLGQIRWAMSGFGHQMNHPIAQKCDPHVEVLCEELAHNIITETLFCRTCEFVCRADKVWREMGCPTGASEGGVSIEGTSIESAAMQSFTGTVRDVNKFGSLHFKKSQQQSKLRMSSSSNNNNKNNTDQQLMMSNNDKSEGTITMTMSSSSNSSQSSGRGIVFPSALPGTNNHLPMPATEHAVQMINASYHNGISVLLGRDSGDCNMRNGGEYQTDAVRYLRYPTDQKKATIEALKRQDFFFVEKEAKEREQEKQRLAKRSGSISGGGGLLDVQKKKTLLRMTRKKAPLSDTAARLLKEAAVV